MEEVSKLAARTKDVKHLIRIWLVWLWFALLLCPEGRKKVDSTAQGSSINGGLPIFVRVRVITRGELLRERPVGRAERARRPRRWQNHPFVALEFRFRAGSWWKNRILFRGLGRGGQLETLSGRYVLCEKLGVR